MVDLKEQQVCVKFHFKLSKNCNQKLLKCLNMHFVMMLRVNCSQKPLKCLNMHLVMMLWVKQRLLSCFHASNKGKCQFKIMNIHVSLHPENVEEVQKAIHEDHWHIIQNICSIIDILYASQQILTGIQETVCYLILSHLMFMIRGNTGFLHALNF